MATETWTERVDSILEQLLRSSPSLQKGLVGCTEADIARIEGEFGHKLPVAFVALLKRIGRSRGELWAGADFAFPELLEYREIADSLMSELEDLELDEQDFVFLMEQGYQFFFFRVGDSENPPVFFYDDDDPVFRKVYDSFTEWLDVCIKEEIDLRSGRGP
jgi:hypothetical protein